MSTIKEQMKISEVIFSQLFNSVDINVIYSWGFDNPVMIEYNGLPGMKFSVNGRLFKGDIAVLLKVNDTYMIKSRAYLAQDFETVCEECYCDNFGDVIDRYVEVGDDKEDYKKFVMGERDKLRSMGIDENTTIVIF